MDTEPPERLTADLRKSERITKGIIIEHLSDSMLIVSFVTEACTAKDIFSKLDAIYERKSLATQLAVENKLLSYKFKEDTPLLKHFILFDEMIVELHATDATLNETSKVVRLLLTLPNSFDSVVTAIQTLSDENLSLVFVKTRLLDYEIKLKELKSETSAKVLNVETQPTSKNNQQRDHNSKKFKNKNNNNQIVLSQLTAISTKIKRNHSTKIKVNIKSKNVSTVAEITMS